MFNFLRKKKKYRDYKLDPDEIFIDSVNLSSFDEQQFEGVLEKPLSSRVPLLLSVFLVFLFMLFSGKLFFLQIKNGEIFFKQSERNLLRSKPIFAERGLIYDRNGVELAWNEEREGSPFLLRRYIEKEGFGKLLGYVHYPRKDAKGFYWRHNITGEAGIEKYLNRELSGKNGKVLIETNARGEEISRGSYTAPVPGKNVQLTIDASLQSILYRAIEEEADTRNFPAGAGAIMDIHTGEILAFVSYPGYDPYLFSEGREKEQIKKVLLDERKPFLNRLTQGLYTPGSTVKPFLALAALEEGLIDENTRIMSTGEIRIPNKYNPSRYSVYRDWKAGGHGLTDVKKALAESVNTFFYAIGGGYGKQEGLGIDRIHNYLQKFDLGRETGIDFFSERKGVIPSRKWKKEHFRDGQWRLGDTYITSIGQFGTQVSPLQMLRAIAAIANNGILLKPILIKGEETERKKIEGVQKENFDIVREGMRMTVEEGTAMNLKPYDGGINVAAKTGTAQLGVSKKYYNSWIVGFFPYKNPKYAFVLVMEKGKKGESGSASHAFANFLKLLHEEDEDFIENLKE